MSAGGFLCFVKVRAKNNDKIAITERASMLGTRYGRFRFFSATNRKPSAIQVNGSARANILTRSGI